MVLKWRVPKSLKIKILCSLKIKLNGVSWKILLILTLSSPVAKGILSQQLLLRRPRNRHHPATLKLSLLNQRNNRRKPRNLIKHLLKPKKRRRKKKRRRRLKLRRIIKLKTKLKMEIRKRTMRLLKSKHPKITVRSCKKKRLFKVKTSK